MKHAVYVPELQDWKEFPPPPGVVDLYLDKVTNYISTPTCPQSYAAAFISGTEPRDTCDHVASDQRNFFEKLFGLGAKPSPPVAPNASQGTASAPPNAIGQPAVATGPTEDPNKKK